MFAPSVGHSLRNRRSSDSLTVPGIVIEVGVSASGSLTQSKPFLRAAWA